MPELPEVETIANDLNKKLKNLVITDFKVINERTPRMRPLLNFVEKEFRKRIVGFKINEINRRAKNIVIRIEKHYLIFHLKMTGQLVFKECNKDKCKILVGGHPIMGLGNELPNKFTRAVIGFNNDSFLYFNDVRRFGWIKLFTENEYIEYQKTLGIEPLSKEFTLKKFQEILNKKKNVKIKQAIMEQKYLVGVGNIYADESLFEAGIKPMRVVKALSEAEIKKIWQAILRILRLAIKHRGTSFSDYLDSEGRKGNFIKYLKVYGRTGQKCLRCGGIVMKTKIGGRGTHWCEECQK